VSGRRNFDQLRARVDAEPGRRPRVEAHKGAARVAVALAELRGSRKLTQLEVARVLGVAQANVSRLERVEDVYLSTLKKYVAALGCTLELHAVFLDGRVKLDTFSGTRRSRQGSAKGRQDSSAAESKSITSGTRSPRWRGFPKMSWRRPAHGGSVEEAASTGSSSCDYSTAYRGIVMTVPRPTVV